MWQYAPHARCETGQYRRSQNIDRHVHLSQAEASPRVDECQGDSNRHEEPSDSQDPYLIQPEN